MKVRRIGRLLLIALVLSVTSERARGQELFSGDSLFSFASDIPGVPGVGDLRLFDSLLPASQLGDLPIGILQAEATTAVGDTNGDGKLDVALGLSLDGQTFVSVLDANSLSPGQQPQVIASYPVLANYQGGVYVATGDINGDGFDDIITGTGQGTGPAVQVFSGQTGQQIQNFNAFDPTFQGGVRVASADVNGDGVPDIITGAGPGAGPRVKVFDGTTGAVLNDFFAFEPSFTGGVFVASGDVNSDGNADLIVGADAEAAPQVSVFSGADESLLGSFFAFDAAFQGGVRVASGDVNGDGIADIITAPGPGGAPVVNLFAFDDRIVGSNPPTPAALTGPFFSLGSAMPYPTGYTGGIHVGASRAFVVPEPATLSLLLLSIGACSCRWRSGGRGEFGAL